MIFGVRTLDNEAEIKTRLAKACAQLSKHWIRYGEAAASALKENDKDEGS